jgi:hypothetical protein
MNDTGQSAFRNRELCNDGDEVIVAVDMTNMMTMVVVVVVVVVVI